MRPAQNKKTGVFVIAAVVLLLFGIFLALSQGAMQLTLSDIWRHIHYS